MFHNSCEISSIFQFLVKHVYLMHARLLTTDSHLAHDSVCNYAFSYRNIQVKSRIGIIFELFIVVPFWCNAVSIFLRGVEIWIFNAKLNISILNICLPFKFKQILNRLLHPFVTFAMCGWYQT